MVRFPTDLLPNEQIALRWIHVTAGIAWIGILYFQNLVEWPTLREIDPAVRGKIFPVLTRRAMWWLRWSALVTVLAGLRYFWEMLAIDAENAGGGRLAWVWFGEWFGVWLAAYAVLYFLQMPRQGLLDQTWVRATLITAVAILASAAILALHTNVPVSSGHLSIAIGGGLGLLMLLNAWGVVWRAQKRLIYWTQENTERGTPLPERAAYLARWSFLASRTSFWLSFPMLFFMCTAGHYAFLFSN